MGLRTNRRCPEDRHMNTKKIVVGANGSAASNAALEWAVREAVPGDAGVIAVHGIKPAGAPGSGAGGTDVRLRDFDYLGDEVRGRVKRELCEALTTSEVKHRI